MNSLTVLVEDNRLGTWVDTICVDQVPFALVVFPSGLIGRFSLNSLRVQDNCQPNISKSAKLVVINELDEAGAW